MSVCGGITISSKYSVLSPQSSALRPDRRECILDEHLGLLIRKGDPLAARVVMHLDAYRSLMTVCRARRPYEVAGVLIGTWGGLQDQGWVTVEDVMPIRLVPAEDDL